MKDLTPPGEGDIHDHYELNDKQLTWMDLTAENTVVTITTITHELYQQWQKTLPTDQDFQIEKVREVGAHQDTDMADPDQNTEGYTVTVPVPYLDPEIMALAVKKLNEQHGTTLQIPNADTELETDDLFDII